MCFSSWSFSCLMYACYSLFTCCCEVMSVLSFSLSSFWLSISAFRFITYSWWDCFSHREAAAAGDGLEAALRFWRSKGLVAACLGGAGASFLAEGAAEDTSDVISCYGFPLELPPEDVPVGILAMANSNFSRNCFAPMP